MVYFAPSETEAEYCRPNHCELTRRSSELQQALFDHGIRLPLDLEPPIRFLGLRTVSRKLVWEHRRL